MDNNTMRQKMADTIRFLAADMVQAANSGHPGAPMGLSDIAVVLIEHLNLNPKNPSWLNRDRLVFSGGHATGLIYSLYYLWGYGLSVDDLKNWWGSFYLPQVLYLIQRYLNTRNLFGY